MTDAQWEELRAEIEDEMPDAFTGQLTIHWHQGVPTGIDLFKRKRFDWDKLPEADGSEAK